MNIVLCFQASDKDLQRISQACGADSVVVSSQETISVDIMQADVFCGHARASSMQPPIDWQQVVDQGRLQWIQSSAAGMDHCLVPPVVVSPIIVSSAAGLFRNQVAEQTMALLYGLVRGMPTFFQQSLTQEFVRQPTDDLHHKSIGILGFGGNGQRIAELLLPLGVRIVATDRYANEWAEHFELPPIDALWSPDRMDEVLACSDVIILTLPLDRSTRHVISTKELAIMPIGSYLLNVGRGPLLDEVSLIQSLQAGHLAGAGLDVTEVEPLPATSPLWRMPNVLITPHVGAQAADRNQRVTDLFLRKPETISSQRKTKKLGSTSGSAIRFLKIACKAKKHEVIHKSPIPQTGHSVYDLVLM